MAFFNWILPESFNIYFDALGVWAETMFQYPEMIQELKGVAKGAHLPFGKMVFINFMYEFSTIHKTYKACTSIVLRNSTGQIIHGRNLDFFLWNRIAPMLANVDYYRGSEYITTIDSIVGSSFALNGFVPGKFAITVDSRYLKPGEATFADVLTNIFVNNYMPSAWNVRETLVNERSFDAAKSRLEGQNVTAPIYYIISGSGGNEGAVIEKKSVGTHAVYQLNETTWFIVQTNYDRNEQDPWYDNRRLPVEKKIEAMGQDINAEDVYNNIMTKWPTFNIASLLTVISVPG